MERLQKIMAAAGVASRRKCEELIAAGRVSVNGQVVKELGTKADSQRDHIRVDGKLLHGAERKEYFLLNKPKGYVTTVSDPEGRPTVMHLLRHAGVRLYPIGRLDYASEGLLLLSNDGALAQKLTRAASHVPKTYLVKVGGQPSPEAIQRLREGVLLRAQRPGEKPERTAPARIILSREGENPWYEVTLTEGRNRQIRRMFEQIGHRAEKIKRVRYGPLELDVAAGEFRRLTPQEVTRLFRMESSRRATSQRERPQIERRKERHPAHGETLHRKAASNKSSRPPAREKRNRTQPSKYKQPAGKSHGEF
jgi:23S rRNA pseudouridine2605 synthase